MRVSDAHKVLFVHVPKTGGSTVDRLFDGEVADARKVDGAVRHAPYARLLQREPELGDYWSFGFVRNPWARMVSWWSMVNGVFARYERGEPNAVAKIQNHPAAWLPEGEFKDDFRRFVLEAPKAIRKVGRTQAHMLGVDSRPVDFIGRLENMDRDINVVREHLGLAPVEAAKRHNVSSHGPYRDYYDDQTRDAVARHYAIDIETFGYTY